VRAIGAADSAESPMVGAGLERVSKSCDAPAGQLLAFTARIPHASKSGEVDDRLETMRREVATMRGFVVLVVDDDADNLELAATIVESFGCTVLKATSCADALAVLDSGAKVDLVFSDVVMPNTSGITLAKLVREREPGMPIVLATGYADAVDDVTDSGAIPLIKPYTISRLEAVFAEQLHIDATPPVP
jgi:CheY-like chemotaxis protein